MSKTPDRCLYCKGDDPNCGFCDMGIPLDTQEDWDKSWGKLPWVHKFLEAVFGREGSVSE